MFDIAILRTFEFISKSFLIFFFLINRQSSRNRQSDIVKAVFDRQYFFFIKASSVVNKSSRCRQGVVKVSSIVNRQSSTCVRACTYVRVRTCVCVCVCGSRAHRRKDRNETRKKVF